MAGFNRDPYGPQSMETPAQRMEGFQGRSRARTPYQNTNQTPRMPQPDSQRGQGQTPNQRGLSLRQQPNNSVIPGYGQIFGDEPVNAPGRTGMGPFSGMDELINKVTPYYNQAKQQGSYPKMPPMTYQGASDSRGPIGPQHYAPNTNSRGVNPISSNAPPGANPHMSARLPQYNPYEQQAADERNRMQDVAFGESTFPSNDELRAQGNAIPDSQAYNTPRLEQQTENFRLYDENQGNIYARNMQGLPTAQESAARNQQQDAMVENVLSGNFTQEPNRFGAYGGGGGSRMAALGEQTELPGGYLPEMNSLSNFAEQRGGNLLPRYREGPFPATQGSNVKYTDAGTPFTTMDHRPIDSDRQATTASRTYNGGVHTEGTASLSGNTMGWNGRQRNAEQQKRFDYIRANRNPRSTARSRLEARQDTADRRMATRRANQAGPQTYTPTQAIGPDGGGAIDANGQPIMMPRPEIVDNGSIPMLSAAERYDAQQQQGQAAISTISGNSRDAEWEKNASPEAIAARRKRIAESARHTQRRKDTMAEKHRAEYERRKKLHESRGIPMYR